MCLGGGVTVQVSLLSYRSGGMSSKIEATNTNQRLLAIQNRYSRQYAVFSQVRKDLVKAGHTSLWKGKVAKYWTRAQVALQLIELKNRQRFPVFVQILGIAQQCGPLWTVRQIFYTWK
jgi:hypothetical protein